MKKNLTITLLILALLSIALSMVFYAEDPHFPPGEGSSNDPYIVTTADQLYAVRGIWDGTVRLEADIVLNDETFTFRPDTGLVMVTDGTNVGYLGTGTKGDASGENTVFDTVASEAGVWYTSDTSAEKGDYPGQIRSWAGFSTDDYESIAIDGNGHTISGMYVSNEGHAGLFSTVWGGATIRDLTIENTYVFGGKAAGGFVGYFDWGSVVNCRFDGIVCGNGNTGGIAGYCGVNATIQMTEAHGSVHGGEGKAAGIAASSKSSIRYCQNHAIVTATQAAGIAGTSAEVYACLNLGNVHGKETAAGIAWLADAVLQSINSASVSANTACAVTSEDTRAVEACYYNKNLFTGNESRATALSTAEMKKKESYSALDFTYTWQMEKGASLPAFIFDKENDLSFALWDGSVADGFASGNGSAEDPYIIENAAQLAYLAKAVNEGSDFKGQFVRLDADIALNDTTDLNWITGAISWTPIGGTANPKDKWDSTTYFGGTFDGGGHTISGLYIDAPMQNNVGLFGYVSHTTIENLNIDHAFVRGHYGVATLAGSHNGGTISNCSARNATVIGVRTVGGLTGGGYLFNCRFDGSVYGFGTVGGVSADGHCQNCQNTERTTVTGFYQVGGVVGNGPLGSCDNYATVIGYSYAVGGVTGVGGLSDSRNYGSVSGNEGVGGVAGICYGTVENCQNYGSVTGYQDVGGIVGHQYYCAVLVCQNFAEIVGTYNVGGILGYQEYDGVDDTLVSFCRNDGNVTGNAIVGGIVGYSEQAVQYCYNVGKVKGGLMVGGITGSAEDALLYCFNLGTVRGEVMVGALSGTKPEKTSGCYLQGSARLTSGEGCFAFGGSDYYDMSVTPEQLATNKVEDYGIVLGEFYLLPEGAPHPYLYWELISPDTTVPDGEFGGSGSKEDPYRIENAEQLQLLSKLTNEGNTYKDCYFELTNDIIFAEGTAFTPIGKFEGYFDGNGHVISGLSITGISNVGLFSHNCGTITSLALLDSAVRGSINVGGIVGYNEGTVENCQNHSKIIGYQNVGGIVGRGGTANYCVNKGAVSASNQYAGGISGLGTACSYCHNEGNVSVSNYYAGGICGYSTSISYCQNDGTVKGLTDVGGIAGQSQGDGCVKYCLNTGKISGNERIGGIVGILSGGGQIHYCINIGTVKSTNQGGGIVAYNGGATGCYYIEALLTAKYTYKKGIAIAEADVGTATTYGEIPSFHDSFAIQNNRPILKHLHVHVYDQENTDNAFLVNAGSCTVPSTYYYSCSCGEAGEKTFAAHTTDNHNPTGEETEPHYKLCADCGQAVKVSEHTYADEIVDGHYKTCIHCGEKTMVGNHSCIQKVIDVKYLHTPGTCKTIARYYYSCACGEQGTRTFPYEYGSHSFGHVLHGDISGHYSVCTVCSNNSDYLAHTYDDGVITVEPTDTELGQIVYSCTACNYKKFEPIDKRTPTAPQQVKEQKESFVPYLMGMFIGVATLALLGTAVILMKKHKNPKQ